MKLLDRINLALRLLIDRGVQTNDGYKNGVHIVQTKTTPQGGALESEHIEPFGFASRAPNGSEHITLSLGGNRSQTLVVFAHNRKYKFELAPGECALYNQFGDHVHLKDDGEAHIKASQQVTAETPMFACSDDCVIGGNLEVYGDTEVGGELTNKTISVGMDHTHTIDTPSGVSGVVIP